MALRDVLFRIRARDDSAGPLDAAKRRLRQIADSAIGAAQGLAAMGRAAVTAGKAAKGLGGVLAGVGRIVFNRFTLPLIFLRKVQREGVEQMKATAAATTEVARKYKIAGREAAALRFISAQTGQTVSDLNDELERGASINELAARYDVNAGDLDSFVRASMRATNAVGDLNRDAAATANNWERIKLQFSEAFAPLVGGWQAAKRAMSEAAADVAELEFVVFDDNEVKEAEARAKRIADAIDDVTGAGATASARHSRRVDLLEQVRDRIDDLGLPADTSRAAASKLAAELDRLGLTSADVTDEVRLLVSQYGELERGSEAAATKAGELTAVLEAQALALAGFHEGAANLSASVTQGMDGYDPQGRLTPEAQAAIDRRAGTTRRTQTAAYWQTYGRQRFEAEERAATERRRTIQGQQDADYELGNVSPLAYANTLLERQAAAGGIRTREGIAIQERINEVVTRSDTKTDDHLYVVLRSDDKPDRVARAEKGPIRTRPRGACG